MSRVAAPVRATVLTGCVLLALTACSPAIDALRGRRDREEAIVPGSSGHASTCVADALERAGAQLLDTKLDAELPVLEVAASIPASEPTGPAFKAWYEFSPRDGRNARVVYAFDAVAPHRDAARALVLAPIRACGGDPAER